MEKISCSIAKDLLPLYIDEILSEESSQTIEAHLQACESCKREYETMRQEFVFPSTPKLQEENKKMLKELKYQLKIKRILTALIAAIITAIIGISAYLVYTNVGAVQDYFTEKNMIVLRDIHTNNQWETIHFEGSEYLNYDRLICGKEVIADINSEAPIDLRISDAAGNVVIDSLTLHPGNKSSLKELKRNTDYRVEIKADADFVLIRFV